MLWLVPLLPLLMAPVLYRWWRNSSRNGIAVSAGGLGIAVAVLVLTALNSHWTGLYHWNDALTLELGISPLTAVFAVTLPLVAIPVLAYASAHEERLGLARLMALLTAFVGAMELLFLARDLLTLLIAWELVGALSWALIAHHGSDPARAVDARWAFLVTRFGDLGLYLAAAVAFTETGSLTYSSLTQLDGTTLDLFTAGIVLAAASKSAQLPFSPWLFAAMSGPTSASALLHSATMVSAGIYLIATLHGELGATGWFAPLSLWLGLTTALAASLVALLQPHGKRLLAASTSAHHGLMWVAVGAGYPAVAALHFAAHAAAKAPLFLAVGIAGERAGSYQLKDLRLGRTFPGLAIASLIIALSLAGLFPMAAAWTKETAVAAAGHYSLAAALMMALAGGLSAAYAARFQLSVFGWRRRRNGNSGILHDASESLEQAPIYGFAVVSLLGGLLWIPAIRSDVEAWLGTHLPPLRMWELLLSEGLVVLGLVLGAGLAIRLSKTTRKLSAEAEEIAADWLGFPLLAQRLLAEPGARAVAGLSRVDGHWDRMLLGGSQKARTTALGLAGVDDGWDRALTRVSQSVAMTSLGLARADGRIIDGGIRAAGHFGRWLAGVSVRAGEWFFDELPEGIAQISGQAARQASRLQSGMLHHYYSIVGAGFAAVLITFIVGELL